LCDLMIKVESFILCYLLIVVWDFGV